MFCEIATGLTGDNFHFDSNGDGPARYNIIHFRQVEPGTFKWIKVGVYSDGKLKLNMSGKYETWAYGTACVCNREHGRIEFLLCRFRSTGYGNNNNDNNNNSDDNTWRSWWWLTIRGARTAYRFSVVKLFYFFVLYFIRCFTHGLERGEITFQIVLLARDHVVFRTMLTWIKTRDRNAESVDDDESTDRSSAKCRTLLRFENSPVGF